MLFRDNPFEQMSSQLVINYILSKSFAIEGRKLKRLNNSQCSSSFLICRSGKHETISMPLLGRLLDIMNRKILSQFSKKQEESYLVPHIYRFPIQVVSVPFLVLRVICSSQSCSTLGRAFPMCINNTILIILFD